MADTAPFRPEVPPVASIISDDVVIARTGRRYSQLSGVEKRDYLFEQGIKLTAYARNEFPDVVGGEIQFTKAAFQTFHQHSLRDSLAWRDSPMLVRSAVWELCQDWASNFLQMGTILQRIWSSCASWIRSSYSRSLAIIRFSKTRSLTSFLNQSIQS